MDCNLKRIREENGISLEQLAKELNTNYNDLKNVEEGLVIVSTDLSVKLTNYFNIRFRDLYDLDELIVNCWNFVKPKFFGNPVLFRMREVDKELLAGKIIEVIECDLLRELKEDSVVLFNEKRYVVHDIYDEVVVLKESKDDETFGIHFVDFANGDYKLVG